MTLRMSCLCLPFLALVAGCADAPSEALDSVAESGTERMVERLARIATGIDRRQSSFVSSARVEELLATGPGPGFQGQITFAGQLAKGLLYAGRFQEATDSMQSLLDAIDAGRGRVPAEFRQAIAELQAIALLKWEEQLDCVEARDVERCLLPVVDQEPRPGTAPGHEAVRAFERLLEADPENAGHRWLLNIAYMLLGEYPDGVPVPWLIEPATFAAGYDVGRFSNRAGDVGLDAQGHAGGAIMDDFDRDGDLDVMVSGMLLEDQLRYFENDGQGGFIERTDNAGLRGIVGGLNLKHADFDNDGFLDVFVLRGAWLPYGQPNSLLRNRGDGTFEDVTEAAGLLDAYSTQTADWGDYDGDGWLDLYVGNESGSRRNPNQLFRNNGDGTFSDVAPAVGASVVGFTKGVAWGDYDNDGDPDLYISLMRQPNVLLANEGPTAGGGWSFRDVTTEAGVAEPLRSFPVWFWDFDNDGWLDVYASAYWAEVADVAAEHLGRSHAAEVPRLYRNNGDGTFTDVAAEAGVTNDRYAKGVVWGDYDNDGDPDLYVSNIGLNRLYRNNGDGTFTDVAPQLGVTRPGGRSFATWFFDHDNDGDLDLFVVAYLAQVDDIAADIMGFARGSELWPRLYRNDGDRFRDVTVEAGLDHPVLPMGANYGDINEDGFLDIYLGTGAPAYEALMPNVMYLNDGDGTFTDVTFSGGFGHLQKGHGISFADLDNDGDTDISLQAGGMFPGDRFSNALFVNPGHGHRFVSIKAVGTRSNRAAIGTRLHLRVRTPAGERSIYRWVGSGGSFGASPLEQSIGLGDATTIVQLEVFWPATGLAQTFTDVPLDAFIRVVEGAESVERVERPRFHLGG